MSRGREPTYLVHVAAEPAPDNIQRCVACGAELLNNRDGDTAWWPPGALIAVDKPRNGVAVQMTYVVGDDLDDDERPCTAAR